MEAEKGGNEEREWEARAEEEVGECRDARQQALDGERGGKGRTEKSVGEAKAGSEAAEMNARGLSSVGAAIARPGWRDGGVRAEVDGVWRLEFEVQILAWNGLRCHPPCEGDTITFFDFVRIPFFPTMPIAQGKGKVSSSMQNCHYFMYFMEHRRCNLFIVKLFF